MKLSRLLFFSFIASALFAVDCGAQQIITPAAPAAPTHTLPPPAVPQPAPQPAVVVQQPPGILPVSIIAWDAETIQTNVAAGTAEAHFTFNLTNISTENVTISGVGTTCGCTVAQLPSNPWVLAPGTNGQIHVTMNLAGKTGTVPKGVTVTSDKGIKSLTVITTILPGPPPTMSDREKNQHFAAIDRQLVLKGDCAKCHVEPAKGKVGQELFAAACAICHDAANRASAVPDLHALNHVNTPDMWKLWVSLGKPNTMMPAFAEISGGFLTEEQINSLVDYLSRTMHAKIIQPPPAPVPVPAAN
jgi:hypothetical protein